MLEQVVHIVTTVSQSVRHYDWEGSHRKAFCTHTAARLLHKGPWLCSYADTQRKNCPRLSATSLHCVQCVKAAVNFELSVQLRLVVYSAYELRSVLFQRRDIDGRSVVSFACE